MAGRPRTPSKILELRGAFKTHPNRRRVDAEGSAPFNPDPPAHLPQDAVPAWNWIVGRMPKIALFDCDEIPTEISARLLARYWLTGETATLRELRAWLSKLGFSPQDRTKLPGTPEPPRPNPFVDFPRRLE